MTHHFYYTGLKKKLVALSKERDCALVGEWIQSIINLLYWCASSTTDGNGDIIAAKWLSVVNHIRNRHTRHGKLFPKCLHGKYKRKWGEAVKWLKPGNFIKYQQLNSISIRVVNLHGMFHFQEQKRMMRCTHY